jgi:hypothetical protein
MYRCPFSDCNKIYKSTSGLYNHKKAKHANNKEIHVCGLCSRTCYNLDALKKHKLVCRGIKRSVVCDVENCGKTFTTKDGLKKHKTNKHSDLPTMKCPLCDFETRLPSIFTSHSKIHRNIEYKCKVCSVKFPTYNKMYYHKIHTHIDDDIIYEKETCTTPIKKNNNYADMIDLINFAEEQPGTSIYRGSLKDIVKTDVAEFKQLARLLCKEFESLRIDIKISHKLVNIDNVDKPYISDIFIEFPDEIRNNLFSTIANLCIY